MSKYLILLSTWLLIAQNATAFSGRNAQSTEAGYCADCGRSGLRNINLGSAGGTGGGMDNAIAAFRKSAEKYGPDCLNKPFIMITDLSRGTDNNVSYILARTPSGGYMKVEEFQSGQGKGVGNRAGSNFSPTGLFRLGNFNFFNGRRGSDGRMYTWPPFENPYGSPPRFNFLETSGLEPQNRNASARGIAFHSIDYATGDTTNGCTGIPMSIFRKYSGALRNSCAYNYSPSAAE